MGGNTGPKRTPKAILDMRGSWRASARKEIGHEDGDCECPGWVGEYGHEAWAYLYPKLRAVPGLMKPAYLLDLALICEAYDDMRDAMDEIERDGPTCVSEKGGQYQHPAVGRKNKAIARILKVGPRFGLNPADVTNIQATESGESAADPFATLMGEN